MSIEVIHPPTPTPFVLVEARMAGTSVHLRLTPDQNNGVRNGVKINVAGGAAALVAYDDLQRALDEIADLLPGRGD